LKCCGVGVHPPLQLSHQVVQFKATALFDTSVASIFVVNNHLDKREYKHPVPRIGTGELWTLTGHCFGSCDLSADKYDGKYRCVPARACCDLCEVPAFVVNFVRSVIAVTEVAVVLGIIATASALTIFLVLSL